MRQFDSMLANGKPAPKPMKPYRYSYSPSGSAPAARTSRAASQATAKPVRPETRQAAPKAQASSSARPDLRRFKPAMRGSFALVAGVLLVGGLVISGVHMVQAGTLSKSTPKATAKTAPVSKFTAAAVNNAQLASQIQTIFKKYPQNTVGVTLVSVADGKTVQFGTTAPYLAGSVGKLMTALTFLHQVEAGKASLTQIMPDGLTAQADLERAISLSDNAAWANLNGYLTHPTLLDYAKSQGITSYSPEDNIIAPGDIAKLLYKLYDQQLLNESNTKLLLSFMKKANYTDYIVSAVPDGVTAYHKVGYLDDRANDVAILDDGKTAYVLVIFSKAVDGGYDFPTGQKMFHELTAATTSALMGRQ